MDVLSRLSSAGIVPVVVLENAEDAIPVARAMLDGGIDVMEITFRTVAAADSIRFVAKEVPEMLVGAGTVVNLEQCKLAVECGAKFIVSPGYDEDIVSWCVDHNIAVTPGCVTPTEIMMALKHGIKVLKFFPANVFGGIKALKSLSGPFHGVKFIPTGGVNSENLAELITSPEVHAVGGSWIVPKKEISEGNYSRITELCKEARQTVLGFELAHVGINSENGEHSLQVAKLFYKAFDFTLKHGASSNFAGSSIEVMKSMYLGANGHIAVWTNKMDAAIIELEKRGFSVDPNTAKYKGERMTAVYLKDEIGGFAVHLLQK